jgi:hypothetical protein
MIGEALPFWARQLVPYLALGHGLFNLLVFGLFVRQGWLGLGIRQARRSGAPPPVAAIRSHRRTGPWAAMLAGLGFLAGTILVLFDKGHLIGYPLHFAVGSMIVLVLFVLYSLSRRITGTDSPYRTPHARLGVLLLGLYLVQAVLGLGILL